MSLRILALAALLLAATGPVQCVRSLEGLPELSHPIATAGVSVEGSTEDKPWFCHDLDCPKYTVINKTAAYETRTYEKALWAGTNVQGLLYTPSVTQGFKRLFDYISGENEGSTKIDMTAPVLVEVNPGQGPFCKSTFRVGFFLPFKFQDKAPKPTNKDVYLINLPEKTTFVSQFGGYLVDDITLSAKVKALQEALTENNESFNATGLYFTASYDPPFRVQHRHNEILINKVEDKSTAPLGFASQ